MEWIRLKKAPRSNLRGAFENEQLVVPTIGQDPHDNLQDNKGLHRVYDGVEDRAWPHGPVGLLRLLHASPTQEYGQHRGDGQNQDYGEQYWSLPGGMVESGESLEEAAMREVIDSLPTCAPTCASASRIFAQTFHTQLSERNKGYPA